MLSSHRSFTAKKLNGLLGQHHWKRVPLHKQCQSTYRGSFITTNKWMVDMNISQKWIKLIPFLFFTYARRVWLNSSFDFNFIIKVSLSISCTAWINMSQLQRSTGMLTFTSCVSAPIYGYVRSVHLQTFASETTNSDGKKHYTKMNEADWTND